MKVTAHSRRFSARPRCRAVWLAAALVTATPQLWAQAVSEWRTPAGLPVAVVEIAGGDIEHLAALVPATAAPPAIVAGWPAVTAARPGALLWSVDVPTTIATHAAIEMAAALGVTGCGGLAAVGPLPARDLAAALEGLAALPAVALWRECILADGREEVLRGSPERVELAFTVPQPDDLRFDTLPALAAVLERRLAAQLTGVRVGLDQQQGCWRLVLRLGGDSLSPRAALGRLRAAIAAEGGREVESAELAGATARLRRGAVMLAADGGALAAHLVERLARGGRAAGAVTPTFPSALALGELMREVLGGRSGLALLVEAERRAVPEAPEVLHGGVILTTRWLAEPLGIVALALGGVDPATGARLSAALAARLADAGWHAATRDIAGVATVTAVVPPGDVPEAIEVLAGGLLVPAEPAPADELAGEVAAALGLDAAPAAESLSMALALPADAEEGVEAARKFLAEIPRGGVRTSPAPGSPRLVWTAGEEQPRLAAVVELPATAAGWLAGEVLAARLNAAGTARAARMSPAGSHVMVLDAGGEASVPELDSRLAAAWSRSRGVPSEQELDAAARRLFGALYGDLPAATARAAAAPFLAGLPGEAALLAPDRQEVAAALAALPAWDALLRFARGPAPAPPPVRKSPGSSRRAPRAPAVNSP